jgi:outer membrane lipoprotein-sorting protein
MRKLVFRGVLAAAILLLAVSAFAQDKPEAPKAFDAEKWVKDAEQAIAKVNDYTMIFHKMERINGKMWPEETVAMKFQRPFKVYLNWIKDPYQGRQTLFVKGWNKDKLRAKEAKGVKKIFGATSLDPTGSLAMEGNRHPITEAGIENLVNKISTILRKAMKAGEIELKDLGTEAVFGRTAQKFEGILPKEKAKGYYAYRVIVWMDTEMKLPVHVQVYDWDNQLIEDYAHENIKLNPGLTDEDFDAKKYGLD